MLPILNLSAISVDARVSDMADYLTAWTLTLLRATRSLCALTPCPLKSLRSQRVEVVTYGYTAQCCTTLRDAVHFTHLAFNDTIKVCDICGLIMPSRIQQHHPILISVI
ncbi:unnamed protein product [Boreogadus saida]